MPATYWVRGKGSADYVKKTWAPEPLKPVDRRIFGYDVDLATFEKYNHQNYSIGFCLYDLAGVEEWATDPDSAAKFPEKAAQAKQIMERIIAEITGKEEQKMKDPRTSTDFISALADIYTETRKTYDAIQASVDRAKVKMDKALEKTKDPKANSDIVRAEYEIAKGEYTIAQEDARNGYRDMLSAYEPKVKDLRRSFADYLEEHYAASPDQLDDKTMALLNSGICTASELKRLAERHHDNPTMLRILGDYARNMRESKKRNLSRDDQSICTAVAGAGYAAKDGSRELAIFDSAVRCAEYGLKEDYDHATRMHNHVTGWLDDLKSRLANLPLTPAEQSVPTEEK